MMIKIRKFSGKKASTVTEGSMRLFGHILFIFIVFISISFVLNQIFVFSIDSAEAETLIYSQAIEKCISRQIGNRIYLGIIDKSRLDEIENCFYLGESDLNRNIVAFRGQVFLPECYQSEDESCEELAEFYFNRERFESRHATHEKYSVTTSPLTHSSVVRNVIYEDKNALLIIDFYYPRPTKHVN